MQDDIDTLTTTPNLKEFTTAYGVKLKLQKVAGLIVHDAVQRLDEPRMPRVLIKGYDGEPDRFEDNPNDPDYSKAIEAFKWKRGMISAQVYLGLGTSIGELPEGFEGPEGTNWSDAITEFSELELPGPEKPRSRYVAWLKYVALDDSDYHLLMTNIMRLGGAVTQKDVDEAVKSFRSEPERDPAAGVPTAEEGGRGSGDQPALGVSGSDTGTGVQGSGGLL